MVIGPNRTHAGSSLYSLQRTCVSGQTCAWDAVVGEMLATGDRVVLLDTCGASNASVSHLLPRSPALGWAETGASGASFSWVWDVPNSTAVTPLTETINAPTLTWTEIYSNHHQDQMLRASLLVMSAGRSDPSVLG